MGGSKTAASSKKTDGEQASAEESDDDEPGTPVKAFKAAEESSQMTPNGRRSTRQRKAPTGYDPSDN
jgi:hypothetical protein